MPMLARLTLVVLTALLLVPAAARAQDTTDCDPDGDVSLCDTQEEQSALCESRESGEQCGPGNGRQTAGGGNTGNVSHNGWPPITGILWKVLEQRGTHSKEGGPLND